jgi:hypothetical protein
MLVIQASMISGKNKKIKYHNYKDDRNITNKKII